MTKIKNKYKLLKRYQEDIWGELYFKRKKLNITKLVYKAASAYLTKLNPRYLDITKALPFRKKKLYKNIKGKSDVMLKRFFLYFLNLNIKRIPSILKKIKRSKISWSQSFALWFESRLDSFLYRLNLFFSRLQLKNWIITKKILVNYKPVYSFNYNLSIGDKISFNKTNKKILINQFKYNYLNWYNKNFRNKKKSNLIKKTNETFLKNLKKKFSIEDNKMVLENIKKKYIYFFLNNIKKKNIYYLKKKYRKKKMRLNNSLYKFILKLKKKTNSREKLKVKKKTNIFYIRNIKKTSKKKKNYILRKILRKKTFLKYKKRKETKNIINLLKYYNSKKILSLNIKNTKFKYLNWKKKNVYILKNKYNITKKKKKKKYFYIKKYWIKKRKKNLSSIPFFFPPYIELDYKLFLFTFWRAPFWHEIPFFTKFDIALIAGNNSFK